MSLNGNTNELNEILDLAKSIEVPTIKSISVNGVTQTPDANKNVDITIPESSGGSEKVIHITDWYHGGYGSNLIQFYMQGFSHFQILSGRTGSHMGECEMLGMVASKYDTEVCGTGHTDATGNGYWQERVYMPMEYLAEDDVMWLSCDNTPLTDGDGSVTGLSVYIRLFNVEEV